MFYNEGDPLKSSVTGPSLLVNCYLKNKFHKKIRVNPPLPRYAEFGHSELNMIISTEFRPFLTNLCHLESKCQ